MYYISVRLNTRHNQKSTGIRPNTVVEIGPWFMSCDIIIRFVECLRGPLKCMQKYDTSKPQHVSRICASTQLHLEVSVKRTRKFNLESPIKIFAGNSKTQSFTLTQSSTDCRKLNLRFSTFYFHAV